MVVSELDGSVKIVGQTYRVDIDERHTSEAADNGDELVKVIGTSISNGSTKQDHEKAEDVLLPLDPRVVFASAAEQLLTCNFDGRVDLQRGGEEDGKRVDELHTIDKLVVLWHVEEDDSLGR